LNEEALMETPLFPLPPVINTASVTALRGQLVERRGAPLELDASEVQRIGGLGLQILLSAARAWAADGQHFAITKPSSAFTEMLRLTGAANLPELGL
jgi:chemotaxis protein CheX